MNTYNEMNRHDETNLKGRRKSHTSGKKIADPFNFTRSFKWVCFIQEFVFISPRFSENQR